MNRLFIGYAGNIIYGWPGTVFDRIDERSREPGRTGVLFRCLVVIALISIFFGAVLCAPFYLIAYPLYWLATGRTLTDRSQELVHRHAEKSREEYLEWRKKRQADRDESGCSS